MKNTIKYLIIFSIAMALLEATVVIYLRELYYPEGFTVVMKLFKEKIFAVELAREAATVIMLISISYIAGRNRIERLSYFLLSFAVWDIFYYVWLKVFVNWPESLFTWDILFLIPINWLGPVLAPVLCSLTMILLSTILLQVGEQKINYSLRKLDWFLLSFGSMIILYTFMKDYMSIILQNGWLLEITSLLRNSKYIEITSTYIPISFDWYLFIAGEGLLLTSILIILLRDYKIKYSLYKSYL